MIKDLNIPGTDLWKNVDDSTTSETLKKSEATGILQAVDELTPQTSGDKFQLNETKCKELRITFSHSGKTFVPINYKLIGQDLLRTREAC